MVSHYDFSPKMTKIFYFFTKGPKIFIFSTKIVILYKKNLLTALVYNFFLLKNGKKLDNFGEKFYTL